MAPLTPAQISAEIAKDLASFAYDPLGFVRWAFPWGVKGGPLENETGPDDWQVSVLEDIGDALQADPYAKIRMSTASGHGIGKALYVRNPVVTPTGIRLHGDLQPGDLVFSANGSPATVLAIKHWAQRPVMRVTFDDGSSVLCDENHEWNVRGRNERRRGHGWRTMETKAILAAGVRRPNGSAQAKQWEIPVQGAVQYPEADLPIDPYLAGVWIGDGSKGTARYGKPDLEVEHELNRRGIVTRRSPDGLNVGIIGQMDGFRRFDAFPFGSHERFIPDAYKMASIDQRMALLSGLMDTDGECTPQGSMGYSTTSERLRDDIVWLARSLGCKAMIQPASKNGQYRGKDGDMVVCRMYWRITITAPFNPFHIARKAERWKPVEARYLTRWISTIEPAGFEDVNCIEVDAPDGLYQAGDFIVTHNSALVSWLVLWAECCWPDARGSVTANTENQLTKKTWPEVTKWYQMLLEPLRGKFTATATAIYSNSAGHDRTWRIDAVPWSKSNPAAFAGLHNKGRMVLLIMDEASEIDDIIWEVTEGATTDNDTPILWLAFGNPTRNTGRFKETFGKFRNMWGSRRIDSRSCKMGDQRLFKEWEDAYGEDSDFFRVRVKGMFPRASSMQFIGEDLVEEAQKREPGYIASDATVWGLDIARHGDDDIVLAKRRGRDARTWPWKRWNGINTMLLAAEVAREFAEAPLDARPQAIFLDVTGIGWGVYDRLVQLNIPNVYPVDFGTKGGMCYMNGIQADTVLTVDRIWTEMREWLRNGGAIPSGHPGDQIGQRLQTDLTGRQYGYQSAKIRLEKKEDMKKPPRSLPSPDYADALALTFFMHVAPPAYAGSQIGENAVSQVQVVAEYDIHRDLR